MQERFASAIESSIPISFFTLCGFALKGEVLSLACPRESTQREGHPVHSSADADVLCSSRIRGRAQLAYAQTGASVIRPLLRCSAAPDGWGNSRTTPNTRYLLLVALTEYRSQSGNRRAPCLRQVLWGRLAGPIKLRVVRASGLVRNAGHRR